MRLKKNSLMKHRFTFLFHKARTVSNYAVQTRLGFYQFLMYGNWPTS